MTVYSQRKLNEEKPSGFREDLKMIFKFLWDVPEGKARKQQEKKVLWRGKAWI